MKPTNDWITDWHYGVEPSQEKRTSKELLGIFQDFWGWADLENKSKSIKQRNSAALHALGGYLVEETGNGHRGSKTIFGFLKGYIDSGDGPLIHHDNEAWQNELDTVCRKLYKYLITRC
ncbi:MAG: hypothetical protein U9R20_02965 [Thermodesulfobacteriota bacterium]|nr:hypothetical protein [Thermodesulfobacteriota bacterium]